MEEQLITYETAKLAKEKGFKWEPMHVYDLSQNPPILNLYGEVTGDYELYAPTQSSLRKWLREEHNLFVLVQVGLFVEDKQTFYCNVFEFGNNLYKSKFRSKTSIYTYEEALEVGLQEALKLI